MTPGVCLRCAKAMAATNDLSARAGERHKGRGLCGPCYSAARRAGTLLDYERTYRPADEVLDDLAVLRIRTPGITYRQAAEQLGMTRDALVQVVVRDRRRRETQQEQSTKERAA
ncbi:hypothetical protein [Labedaea rhizosphaerae]|nr:hypothetical protein [Labedaea rhizosphaerae]